MQNRSASLVYEHVYALFVIISNYLDQYDGIKYPWLYIRYTSHAVSAIQRFHSLVNAV